MNDRKKFNDDKRRIVAQISEKMSKAGGVILAEYQGLTVSDLTQLRVKLRQIQGELRILQNRLAKVAVKEACPGGDSLNRYMTGPTAAVFAYGDPVALAKAVKDFAAEKVQFKIKAGLISGRFMESPEIVRLATLPSREMLIGQLVGLISSPLRRLVTALGQPQRNLVMVLSQVVKKKEEGR